MKRNRKTTFELILFDHFIILLFTHSFKTCTVFDYFITLFPSSKIKASQT